MGLFVCFGAQKKRIKALQSLEAATQEMKRPHRNEILGWRAKKKKLLRTENFYLKSINPKKIEKRILPKFQRKKNQPFY